MTLQPHRVELIVLAVVVTILAMTAWAGRDWAGPISSTETTIYGAQHLNVY
jgi:hypothetical protein